MIVLAVAAALVTLIEDGSPVRGVVIFAAFLLVPGWSLVTLLPSGPPAAMLGLAIGLSIAMDVLASLALVWAEHFEDVAVLAGSFGTVAVLLLARDLARRPPPSRTDIPAARAGA